MKPTPRPSQSLNPEPRALWPRAIRLWVFGLIVAAGVICDQWVKVVMESTLVSGRPSPFIPGVMELSLVHNTGAAFSLGEGAGWVFIILAIFIVGFLAFAVWRMQDMTMLMVVCAALVAAGGLGNMIDRLLYGYVIDFFATTFIDFAIFNVADIMVSVGVILGLVALIRYDTRQSGPTDGASDA